MIESTTELTLVPKAPPAAPATSAPARGPGSVSPAPARPVGRSSGAASAPDALAAQRHAQRLEFTGTGGDYFRVWIVNALLTLATLGVYSAWAKRRKARWFARHTLLAGEPFDFHGDPRRILAGRVIALILLIAYGHAFDWSAVAGFAMLAVLYAAGPMLFAGAQRFKLGNTSWRGLRFGFQANAVTVYASCLPLLVAWTLASLVAGWGSNPLVDGLAALALFLLLPLAHGRLKRFQHRHARYGTLAFDFQLSVDAFYGLYVRLGLALIVGGVVAALLGFGVSAALKLVPGAEEGPVSTVLPLMALAVVWTFAWPVYVARLQHLTWTRTHLSGGIGFAYAISEFALFKTLLTHGLLTLLTLGLYWPFLAVRIAKMRIEGLVVLSDTPIGELVVTAPQRRGRGAIGDGAAEAFGLDIGW
ncbi:YjgN family protein [Roseateles sp. UC29_93]|uniref:YjgN family protein n=1 Tax=Roseateles sp. UC29_93 TaxID=3350177 RepID=UPI00366E7E86